MFMNKKLSLVALTAITALALTGCAANNATSSLADKDGNILLTTNVNVSKMPSWEQNSMSVLKEAKWSFTKVEPNELQKTNKDFPAMYSAINEDGSCNINMAISAAPEQSIPDTEDYTTREYVYNNIKLQNGKSNNETTNMLTLQGVSDKLEMLEVSYNYPNKVFPVSEVPLVEGQDPTLLPTVEPTVDGQINVVSLTRVLTSSVNNPFYIPNVQIDENDLPPGVVGKTGRPVITMTYSCLNTKPDMKLWDNVVANSVLSLPVIKK